MTLNHGFGLKTHGFDPRNPECVCTVPWVPLLPLSSVWPGGCRPGPVPGTHSAPARAHAEVPECAHQASSRIETEIVNDLPRDARRPVVNFTINLPVQGPKNGQKVAESGKMATKWPFRPLLPLSRPSRVISPNNETSMGGF